MSDDPRNRRSYLDDDDDDASSRTSPFYYDDEDDDDSLYGGYGSSSYGSRPASGSGSASSSKRYDYDDDDDDAAPVSSKEPAARPKDSRRPVNPRPERGKSRFDREKKSGAAGGLSDRFNALRKRLPGGGASGGKGSSSGGGSGGLSGGSSGGSASGASAPARTPFNRNRASNVRTVGGSAGGTPSSSFGGSPGGAAASGGKSARGSEKKGGLLGSLSNPFKRPGAKAGGKPGDKPREQSGGKDRSTAGSKGAASSGRARPKATPNRVKKARSLPADQKRPRVASQGISLDRKLDMAGIAMIIGAAVIFFGAVSGNEGDASGFILHLLYQLVGIGWFAGPLALGGTGLWLILRHFGERAPEIDPMKIAGWIVMFVGAVTTAHFIHLLGRPVTTVDQLRYFSDEAAQAGHGGGWLGGQIYLFFIANIGDIGTFFALIGWWIIALIMSTDLSAADIMGVFMTFSRRFQTRRKVAQAEQGTRQRARIGGGSPAAPDAAGGLAELTPAQRSAALERPVQQALPERATATDSRALRASDTLPLSRAGQPTAVVQTASSAKVAASANPPASPPSPGTAPGGAAAGRPVGDRPAAPRSPSTIDLNRQGVTRIRRAYSPADEFEEDALDDAEAVALPDARFRPPVVQTPPVAIPPAQAPTGEVPAGQVPAAQTPSVSTPPAPTPAAQPSPLAASPAARPSASSEVDDDDEDEDDDGVIDAYPAALTRVYATPAARPAYSADEDDEDDADEDALRAEKAASTALGADDSAEEDDDGLDESFFKPAQPRDPERARQRFQMRQRGAGLSPAERAALMGQYAGSRAEDEEEEDLDEPEDGDYEEDTVYESVADPALAADDIPAIELDTLDDDEDAENDVGWHIPGAEADEDDEDEDDSGLPPRRDVTWQELRSRASGAPVQPRPQPQASPPPQPRAAPPVTEARSPINEYRPAAPTGFPRPAAQDTARSAAASAADETTPDVAITAPGQVWDVPNFTEILEPSSEQNIDDDVLLERARIIEDTLGSFGAPGKVVEVNPGPAITQFGVEPDYVEGRAGRRTRVKVQAIARLADDLALSLAARSIRIEAPVPGKGFVGIEVPNTEVALVSLYDVMESREFKKVRQKSKLAIGLGQSVDGTPVAADLTAMPHLLIAGTTGSGKSVCVNAIITCLLLQNTPDEMRLIMVDPKRVELTGYNGIPHLVAPVVVELERIVGVLKWVTREMDERYKKFNQATARNIADFNSRIGKDILDEKPLPYLVVIIDELADLMMLAPDETERVITRLAQMARATGIHLIISTQRPSVDVVTGLIKANFPARVAFAVASSVDSRVILDQPGAERLLGRGDMLFQAPDAAAPARLQGVFVSDDELNRLVRYWKGLRTVNDRPAARQPERSEPEKAPSLSAPAHRGITPAKLTGESANPWDRMVPLKPKAEDEDVDELYDEAVEVVRALKKASVSLLQRQLRIGYTRAARLIDIMEERGVVGPPTSGSKPRKVVGYSDDADFDDLDDEDDE